MLYCLECCFLCCFVVYMIGLIVDVDLVTMSCLICWLFVCCFVAGVLWFCFLFGYFSLR